MHRRRRMLVLLQAVVLLVGVPEALTGGLTDVTASHRPSGAPPSEVLILDQVIESLTLIGERQKRHVQDVRNPLDGSLWDENFNGGTTRRLKVEVKKDSTSVPIADIDKDTSRAPTDVGATETPGIGLSDVSPFWSSKNSTRIKRLCPWPSCGPPVQPPPNSRPVCPRAAPLPSQYNKLDQLKHIVKYQSPNCVDEGCARRCRGMKPRSACNYDFEMLSLRLTALEARLQDLAMVETRIKVHASLLLRIQNNPTFPGQRGEPGPLGPKGQKGSKGPIGSIGAPGACTIASTASPPAGSVGVPGNKGAPGYPGDKRCGCDGEPGEEGAPGASVTGPPGATGTKGIKGARGPSS